MPNALHAESENRSAPSPAILADRVDLQWAVKIPLRDGVMLNATVYLPRNPAGPCPCVFTLTPYIGQTYHERGMFFASHGLPFLTVDVRGRGNSGGEFRPLIQEADDGYDVVEWLAAQPYCNGKVAMWGGSYAGYDQWATAREAPPHLATIVPVASACSGVDFPARNNIPSLYLLQWLLFTAGRASQDQVFADTAFWWGLWRRRFEAGSAFATLGEDFGFNPPALQAWIANPDVGPFHDAHNPTEAQYRAMTLPILTITGSYDDDQPGALAHYRQHLTFASAEAGARHYLVIGPWDHAGTRTPLPTVGGVSFGPDSLLDLPKLHLDWYAWTMSGGPRPAFLEQRVAYYVMGAERWRYADTLEAVTAETEPLFLDSMGSAGSILASGALAPAGPGAGPPDRYVYDPRDTSTGALEAEIDPECLVDQRLLLARDGKHLVYHSPPLTEAREIAGFFRLEAWIALDQPDTDFSAAVYELTADGQSIRLTNDLMRARYRESLRSATLVETTAPQCYDFNRFTFVARRIAAGSRLRLVIGPTNSIYLQKNYNSGGVVAQETLADSRPVTVTLFHDRTFPSVLHVPYGAVAP